MKKTIIPLMLLIAGVTCPAPAQTGSLLKLSGRITDVKHDTLTAYVTDLVARANTYQAAIPLAPDGTFSVSIPATEVTQLTVMEKLNQEEMRTTPIARYFVLPLIPGEEARVEGTLDNLTFSGTAFYKDYDSIAKMNQQTEKEMSELYAKLADPALPAADKAALQQAGMQARTARAMSYIRQHPDREAAVSLVSVLNGDSLRTAINLFTPEVRNGRMRPLWQGVVTMNEKLAATEAASKTMKEGIPAPDFTLKDVNGNDFALSSLRGKYVVLDFWGSWCGWCIKGFPEMKKAYAKHKDKVEFVGVACQDTEAKWKAAVAKHALPWTNVFNSRTDNVDVTYALKAFPTKVVISPEGIIVKIVVGESADFYTYLDKLLD